MSARSRLAMTYDKADKVTARQISRFVLVGIVATLVHTATYLTFLGVKLLAPLSANFVAFLVAFGVSFFGHRRWTFDQRGALLTGSLVRFFGVSLLGLALNSMITLATVDLLHAAPAFAVIGMGIVTPPLTFIISKFWAFKREPFTTAASSKTSQERASM